MPTLRDLADRLWHGLDKTSDPAHHPMAALNQIEEVAPGVAFYKDFSNLAAVRTEEGLVLLDTGSFSPQFQQRSFDKVRSFSAERVHTAVYSHGHVDHAYGLVPFLRECEQKSWPTPRIIAHEAVLARFERYRATAGWNSVINSRQFSTNVRWPTDSIPPTVTYRDKMQFQAGSCEFRLFHARGETDDHTWIFLPRERIVYAGDLFIWAAPNAGNPQKVQRYAGEWAKALRAIAALAPVLLLPGHGLLVDGEARVRAALSDTAEYLESLERQTIDSMNQGARLDSILHQVKPPAHLAAKPYLQPVYDEPEFIVRNIWRLYGGWYSGVPSELKPAPVADQAREIARLAGGAKTLIARANELAGEGNWRLACHLVDWAAEAEPANTEAHKMRADVYRRRAAVEPSTMSKGVFNAAARESAGKAGA